MKRFLFAVALLLVAQTASAGAPPEIRKFLTLRSAAILTTSYVASSSMSTQYQNQVNCLVNFTKGSLTTAELKFQFSDDDSVWYDEPERASPTVSSNESVGVLNAKVYQLDATAKYLVAVPVMAKYLRASIKGTGTVTSSSATITCYGGAI